MKKLGQLLLLCLMCVTVEHVRAMSKYRTPGSNVCSLTHNGCHYNFVLTAANCPDDTNLSRWTRELPIVEQVDTDIGELDVVPVKKLDQLERKLVKMMEALSIRSLRHIRQIKSDLRQVTGTLDFLRTKTGKSEEKYLECPPEFTGIGTWPSCYRFSTFNTSWHQAREYCAAFGANLVAMDTLKEAYILDYLIKSNQDYKSPLGWWTSGNYIVRNRRWMWTTKHHLKPIDFSHWAPGEPDARSTMHCMMMDKTVGYLWHDAKCSDKYNFICEIDLF